MRSSAGLECLKCTLPICDETSAECLYRIPIREHNRVEYQKFYQLHRSDEIQRVREWQKENKDHLNAYQRKYWANRTPEQRDRRNARRREREKAKRLQITGVVNG